LEVATEALEVSKWDVMEAKMVNVFEAKVNRRPKFKFGIQVPRNPHHAMELGIMYGTNAWKEVMGIELGQINEFETFRVLEANDFLPESYKKIPNNMVFDAKFDLRRKAGVVSLDTIQLGFALASMNGLTLCS
jgi:hypothetical protein